MKAILCLALIQTLAFAGTGADLLMKKSGPVLDSPASVKSNKTIKLEFEDSFQIQLYNSWKSLGESTFELNTWMNSIFNKEYRKASHLVSVLNEKTPEKFHRLINAASLYLYWKVGLNQTFFNNWLYQASENNFLSSELGVALEHIISDSNPSSWFVENSIVIGPNQKLQLKKIEDVNSLFNNSAQAWNSLRLGEAALGKLSKLPEGDPLRFQLAKTIVVDYSRQGKLSAAASILKEVFEPKLANSTSTEEVVDYYLLLARLLYQAGALDVSADYYAKVPDESKQFLQARVEKLWISLRKGEMPKLKGDLKSLSLDMFEEKFLPEIYLVSSISHLKLCQFDDVKEAFDKYVSLNKNWSKRINTNIKSENPEEILGNDFYLNMVKGSIQNLENEKRELATLSKESLEAVVPAIGEQKHWLKNSSQINSMISQVKKSKTAELRKRWVNRKKILASSIRKMRFVKVEFISLMRKMADKIKQKNNKDSDEITTFSAATRGNNQIKFPFDGVLFGDELFNMSAEVRSLCLSGLK